MDNLKIDFMGTRATEVQLTEKQFLQNKCCDVRQLEKYYIEQERLYFLFQKPIDIINQTFVLNMRGLVAKMPEAKFEAEAIIDLINFSSAQLYQMATELIQNHCKNQDLRKHMKQIEKTTLSKYCNNKPNKFNCDDSGNLCSCSNNIYSKKKKA